MKVDLAHWKWARIARRGYHERDTERFMAEYLRPGDVALDIGANIGFLTALAAKLVTDTGRIYAFEVDSLFFEELELTLDRNSVQNVQLERMALLDSTGDFTFVRPEGAWGSFLQRSGEQAQPRVERPAIDSYFLGRPETSYVSPATTLDEYVRSRGVPEMSLIKIDVDGPELAVLRGARETLARDRPALIVEASMFYADQGIRFDQVFDFLMELEYALYVSVRGRDEVCRLRSPQDLPIDIPHVKEAVDLFCLPGERESRCESLWFFAGA